MVKWHNQSFEFMHCVVENGKKIAMPRYYKMKIYDEYTRIMFGKLGLEKMQKEKADKLSKYGVSIQQYEERHEQQKHALYNNQIKKSAERQKIF